MDPSCRTATYDVRFDGANVFISSKALFKNNFASEHGGAVFVELGGSIALEELGDGGAPWDCISVDC